MTTSLPIRTFDCHDDYAVVARSRLPHWSQAGTLCFLTFRAWDSLPRPVLHQWHKERNNWLRMHGIDLVQDDWRRAVARLPQSLQDEFHAMISERWESHLDDCHGQCSLRHPELAAIVAKSLLHFDEQRYVITDYVVMPNHVHVLAAFLTETAMLEQCDSWKHFTAVQINRQLGRQGRFWQDDQFDHLVRSADWFDHFRRYIADNPARARLEPGEYLHFSKDLTLRR